ncbi:mucin-17 isoform X3 [Dendroctonus ponderosae]|uniref:mucin-17 isoform X3 n=1 Tax=Dendroctonus ponderosae TaxID=77166 RepID=UPI002034FA58|nr:mucin-17 isoform X3 [Dendroctonus ponderosae]
MKNDNKKLETGIEYNNHVGVEKRQNSDDYGMDVDDNKLMSEMIADATTMFIKQDMKELKKTTVEELKRFEKEKLFSKADELLSSEKSLLTKPTTTVEAEYLEAVSEDSDNLSLGAGYDDVVSVGVNQDDLPGDEMSQVRDDDMLNKASAMVEADLTTEDSSEAKALFAAADELLNDTSNWDSTNRGTQPTNLTATSAVQPHSAEDICEVQTVVPQSGVNNSSVVTEASTSHSNRARRDDAAIRSTHIWEEFDWPTRRKKVRTNKPTYTSATEEEKMPSFLNSLSEEQSTSSSILQSMSEIFSNPSSEERFETFTETFQPSSDFQMSTNTYSNEESDTVKDQTSTAIAEVISSTVYSVQGVARFSERYKNNRSKFKEDFKFLCDPCPRKSALSATSSQGETETSEFHSVNQKSTQEGEHASISVPNEIYTEASNSQSKFEDFTAEAATESEKRKFSSVPYEEEATTQQEKTTALTSNESSGITATEQESSIFSNTITELVSSNNNQELSSEEESVSYDSTEQTTKLLPTAAEGEPSLETESESSISAAENYGPITKSPDQNTGLEEETISSTTFETSMGISSNHDQEVNSERNSTVINESVSKDNHASKTSPSESDESNLRSMSYNQETLSQEEYTTFMNNEAKESTESVFTNRENIKSPSDHNHETSSSIIQAISESSNIMTESIPASANHQFVSRKPEQETTLEEEITRTEVTNLENENVFSSIETESSTVNTMNRDQESTLHNENTEFTEDIERISMHYRQQLTIEGGDVYSEKGNTLLSESASRATVKEFGKSIQTESVTNSAVEMQTVLRSLTTEEQNKPNYEVPTIEYVSQSTEISVASKKEQDRKHKMSQEQYKIDYQKYVCDPCPRANRFLKKFRHHTVKDEYFPTHFESSTHAAKISDIVTQQPPIIRNKLTDYQQGITREFLHNPAEGDIDNRLETQLATEFGESHTKNMQEQASTFVKKVSLESDEQSESELNAFTETLKLISGTLVEAKEINKGDVFTELPSEESNEESTKNGGFEAGQGTAVISPLQPLFASEELRTRMLEITTKETDESGTSHISAHIPLFQYSQASLVTEAEEMYSKAAKKTSEQLSENSEETSSNTEMLSDLERTREVENEDQTNHAFGMHRTESTGETDFGHYFGRGTLSKEEIGQIVEGVNLSLTIQMPIETDILSTSTTRKSVYQKGAPLSSMKSEDEFFTSSEVPVHYVYIFAENCTQPETTSFQKEDKFAHTRLFTSKTATEPHNFGAGTGVILHLTSSKTGQSKAAENKENAVTYEITSENTTEHTKASKSATEKITITESAFQPSEESESITSEHPRKTNSAEELEEEYSKQQFNFNISYEITSENPTEHTKASKTATEEISITESAFQPSEVSESITSEHARKTNSAKELEEEYSKQHFNFKISYEITSENPTEHTKALKTTTEKITITESAFQPSEESESITSEHATKTNYAEELEEEHPKQDFNLKSSSSQEMGAAGSLNESERGTSEFITSKSKTQNIALSTSEIKTDHLLRSTTELVTTQNVHRKHTKSSQEFLTVVSTTEIENNLVGMETTPCNSTPTAPPITTLNTETQYGTLSEKTELERTEKLFSTSILATSENIEKEGETEYETVSVSQTVDEEKESQLVPAAGTEEAATSEQVTEEEDNKTSKGISRGEFYEYSKNTASSGHHKETNESTAERFSETKIDEFTVHSEPQLVEETYNISNPERSTSEYKITLTSLYNNDYRTSPPMDDNKHESSKRKESSSSTESEVTRQEVNETDSEESTSAKDTFDRITTESASGETEAVSGKEEETFSKYTGEENHSGSSILTSFPTEGLTKETATGSEGNFETISDGNESKSTTIAPQSAQMSTTEQKGKLASEINAESEQMDTDGSNVQETDGIKSNKPYNQTMQESETEMMANSEEESITRFQTDQILTVSPVSTLANHMHGKSSPLAMGGEPDRNTTENAEDTVETTSENVEKSEAYSQSEISDTTALSNDEETSVTMESDEGLASNDDTTELNTESASLTEGNSKQELNSETQEGFTHTTTVREGTEATEVSELSEVASEGSDATTGENTASLEGNTSEEDNATKVASNENKNLTDTSEESGALQEFTTHLSSENSMESEPEEVTKNSLESSETTEGKPGESSLEESKSEESSSTEIKELTTNELGQRASSTIVEGSIGSEVSTTENISDHSELNTNESTESANVSDGSSQGMSNESKSEESSSTEIKELTPNELGLGASSTIFEGSIGSEVGTTENISDHSELNTNESTENANESGASSQGIEQIESSTTETTGNTSSHDEVPNETGLNENSVSESNTGPDNQEFSSSENISSKSASEETEHVESSHNITEQTEPGENKTSEPNENLSSSEHFANQTEPSASGTPEGTENVASSAQVSDEAESSESSSTESTDNLLSSEPANASEGTENETISEGKEIPSDIAATESSEHLSSSISTETETAERDTSEDMENLSSTRPGLNGTEREESFNSGASGMSTEISEGTTLLQELENASPINNTIESEVTGEGKGNTSGVHKEEHSTLPVEVEEGTQSSFEESRTHTKGTVEISTGPYSEQESQSVRSSEITEKRLSENTESINVPEQTGLEASSTEETHEIHSENAVNAASTTEVESGLFEFGSSTECKHCHTTNSETSPHSYMSSANIEVDYLTTSLVTKEKEENEVQRTTSPEENVSRHEGSSHGYMDLETDSPTEINTVSSTHHHLKQTKGSEETLLTTTEIENGLVAMQTTPCEYCTQSASDHHSTASAVETESHSTSLSTATHEQSQKEVFEQTSQTENEIEETSKLEHDLYSKTTLRHSTSTSATRETYTEEEEKEEVTKLHSHSTMEKFETEKESTHVSKTTEYPTFSTTEETEPPEEIEEQTTVSLVHTTIHTEEPTTKQAAITNGIENHTEKIQKISESSTETVTHKPVVYVINNSKGKYKKINELMIEQIISTGVPNVELHVIDLNDEEVPKSLETMHNRSWDINIPHQICSKADFDSENNCFCNINSYLDTLENRVSKKEEIKAKNSYCKSFFKLTKGLSIENSIEPIKRKRRGLIYLDDKKKKSDTLNFDSIEGMFDQSFKLPISEANMFYLPTETVNILCSNSSAEHQKDVSWTWSFYPISSPNAQLLPERGSELVIHDGLLKHSGNYTCKHEKTHHLPAAEHWHELEMLTFPIYQIILNIYYKINDSCSLQIGDTLYAYLPKIISPLLCTKDGEVCSLDIDRPRCLTREDDNYFNVTINVKTISDFVLRFSTTCDINCKLSVYENVVNMVYKNSEMIVKLPVLSKLDQLHQIDFIPHLNGKVGSPVTIKAPKVVVNCAAGFGLESEKQRVCVVCPPQTFSPDNAAFCTSCPGGQYQPEAGSKTCIQCNSPVDDKLCLRMLYTNTKLFKIYVGVAFAVIVLMIIIIIVWTSGFKDDSHVEDRYKGSLRHRAASNRKDIDLETGVNAPLLGRSPNRAAPQLPPLDF